MLKDLELLVEAGFAVHLLKPRSKAPLDSGWSKAPVGTFRELLDDYRDGMNVGVRLGKPSRVEGLYLHVIDLDIRDDDLADEAHEALNKLFPTVRFDRLPSVQSGSRGESRHFYFLSEDPFRSTKLAHSEHKITGDGGSRHWAWEIELFGTGKQVAMPPSIHPDTGKSYRWIVEPDLEIGIPTIDAEVISDIISSEDEFEHDNFDPLNISFEEAEDALAEIQDWANDRDTWVRVGMALKHEFGNEGWKLFDRWSKRGDGYDRRGNIEQWNGFKSNRQNLFTMRSIMAEANYRADEREIQEEIDALDDLGPDIADEFEDLPPLKDGRETLQETAKPQRGDPDLTIIQQAREYAPAFPKGILSPFWQRQVEAIALNTSAPVDYVVGALFAFAGSVIGNSRWAQVHDEWREPPILWCQVIGSPSDNKSPAMSPFISIASYLESLWEPEFKEEHRNWISAKKIADKRRKQWEDEQAQRELQGEAPEVEVPESCIAPPEPIKRRVIITDATLEAMTRVAAGNPRGLLNFRDEMSGWFQNLSRYSQGSDRPAWLEAYGGRPYVIDRVKDEGRTIRIDRFSVGIVGGIQPDKLLAILDDGDDGLQSRFMPFWPEVTKFPFTRGQKMNDHVKRAFERLSELEMFQDSAGRWSPFNVPLSEKAIGRFGAWVDQHMVAEMWEHDRLKGVYGKARGQVLRLSLVLELLDWAADDFDEDDPEEISVGAVERAIRFREEYLKPMQRRVFVHGIQTEEMRMVKAIAQWIASNGIEEFNASEVRRKGLIPGISGRTSPEDMDSALLHLVQMRWVRPEQAPESGRGRGRPSKTYHVNERLWDILDQSK